MKTKENTTQRMIQKGQIDYYVPMQFVTRKNADTVCQKIYKGIMTDINDCSKLVKEKMEETLQQEGLFDSRVRQSRFSSLLFNKTKKKKKDVVFNELQVVIDTTDKGVELSVLPGQFVAYQKRLQDLKRENEQSETIYGNHFLQSHRKILLPPFAITLHNDENVWLSAILYVFGNKMAVLKLELPILNTPFSMLQELGTEHLIKEVTPPWGMEANFEKSSLEDIWKAYLGTINRFAKLQACQTEKCLQNVILTRFDDRPKYVQSISDDLLFEFYRIVSAPVSVPKGNLHFVKQKAKEYMNTHSVGDIGIRYFLNIAGSCLSIVDESMQEEMTERLLANDIEPNEQLVNYVLTSSAYINIEFSLIVLLLKTLNSTFAFNQKLMNKQEYLKAQKLFNESRIFIAHIQEECYGSVSEQVTLVEEFMPYYRKQDVEVEKSTAIDQIIIEETSRENERSQRRIAVLGTLITLIVGLPSIVDTIKILRPWATFLPKDIPYVTVEGVSSVLWIILAVFLAFVMRKRR